MTTRRRATRQRIERNRLAREISDRGRGGFAYADRKLRSIGLWRWEALWRKCRYRVIGHRVIGGRLLVSTVWLGTDHSFGLGGPPLYFETMLFLDPDVDMRGQGQWRWPTEEIAQRGHNLIANTLYAAVWNAGASIEDAIEAIAELDL